MSTRRRSDPRLRALLAALLLTTPLSSLTRVARAADPETSPAPDPMEPLRERFRVGMEQYRAGRFADAILTWEQIHRELGPETGYRLSYNLGRAYDAAQDLTKAAEHYESYLAQVASRRARSEPLEPLVEKQEGAARERLAQLVATRGRIEVASGERPTVARVDNGEPRLAGFVAYVAPGSHAITFGTGAATSRTQVSVREGEIVVVSPPALAVAPPEEPRPARISVPPGDTRPREPPPPFSSTWLYVAGGVTLASAVLPVVGYANALSTKSDFQSTDDRAAKERLAADYDGERGFAYGSLAVTGGLAAITLGLGAAWLWWRPGAARVLSSGPVAGTF